MNKQAVLVLGGEGTGTRVLTRVFLQAGYEGDDGHVQRWDSELPDRPRIVWRRSAPHGGSWPDIRAMVGRLRSAGYSVFACVTSRDWAATIRSQLAAGHVATAEAALANLRHAYAMLPESLERLEVPYVIASYESLAQRPEAITELLLLCGATPPARLPTLWDGNAKHFRRTIGHRLTEEQRRRLIDVNEGHHHRMAAMHQHFVETNALSEIQRLDAASTTALLDAMRGCAQRYSMRIDPSTVLELGASTGHKSAMLMRELAATEYTGVEVVAATAAASPLVFQMALEEMPFEWAGRFSFVFSRHVMEHVVDVDTALRSIKMVLAPNGIIGAVTPHFFPDPEPAHLTQLRKDQWIAAYERNGLKVVYATLHQSHCAECHIVAVHREWPTEGR